MSNYKILEELSKEELIRLLEIYSKNLLAMDGVWFQSVEQKNGMEEAMHHDREAWRRYTVSEAKRIKEFLKLPERGGIEGLMQALQLRFYGMLNQDVMIRQENTLIYRMEKCRVQTARERKGLPFHPCKSVGEIEYAGFAKVIDERFRCECLSCYPDVTDSTCCCAWKFTLVTEDTAAENQKEDQ